MKNTKAFGIETISGEKITAEKEVIICQGAFGTPHLLMLSGIGNPEELTAHGIKPVIK